MNHSKSLVVFGQFIKSSLQILLLLTCIFMVNGQQIFSHSQPGLQVQQYGDDVIELDQIGSSFPSPLESQLASQESGSSLMYLFAPNQEKYVQDTLSTNQALLDGLRNYYLGVDKTSIFKRQGLDDEVDNEISAPVNDPGRFEIAYNETSPDQQQRQQPEIDDNNGQSVRQDTSEGQLNNVNAGVNQDEGDEIPISQFIAANNLANGQAGSEYIDHPLILTGHQYVQGGAGEGKQLLGPEGTFENVQVVKSDSAIPSYCDPPNPCPIGYTATDGCLEEFVNSASFSRDYQANQQCSCDNEHSLFNCAAPVSTGSTTNSNHQEHKQSTSTTTNDNDNNQVHSNGISNDIGDGGPQTTFPMIQDSQSEDDSNEINPSIADVFPTNKLETIARTIKNRFGGLEGVHDLLAKERREQQQNYLFN